MKRICVNVTETQFAKLKARQQDTGVPQAEQIRRALDSLLLPYMTFSEFSSDKERDRQHAKSQPVLLTSKRSE